MKKMKKECCNHREGEENWREKELAIGYLQAKVKIESKVKVLTHVQFLLVRTCDSPCKVACLMAATQLDVVGPTRAELLPRFMCNCSGFSLSSLPGLGGHVFQK